MEGEEEKNEDVSTRCSYSYEMKEIVTDLYTSDSKKSSCSTTDLKSAIETLQVSGVTNGVSGEKETKSNKKQRNIKLKIQDRICSTEKEDPHSASLDACLTKEEPEVFSIRDSIIQGMPNNLTCMLCCTTFDDPFELQAHLAIQYHGPREKLKLEDFFLYPVFDCLLCNAHSVNKLHPCVKKLATSLITFLVENTKEGSPVTCILCDGKIMQSVHHLMTHISIFHGFRSGTINQHELQCPFCYALFRTRNSVVLESHALNVHLPEMVITKQKKMHPEGQEPYLTVRHFSCFFENDRYNFLNNKESGMQNCASLNNDLSSLIGHLCYAHYPLPSDFKFSKARPITCNACLYRFTNRTDLRDHISCSHNSFIRFRAASLSLKMNFEEHGDPRVTCHFCWSNQGSVIRLQTHILVYHVGSWRECGFCEREFCRANEYVSPQIIYMTMERHVDYHMEQLKAHFEEQKNICQLRKKPYKQVYPPDPNDMFFQKMEIRCHKMQYVDNTDAILTQIRCMARTRSPSYDDYDYD